MPEAAVHLGSGKVRELYALDDERLLLVASDRISTFDVILPTPRSRTRAACSPVSPRSGSRGRTSSSRTICSRSATTAGRSSAGASRCSRSRSSSAAICRAPAGRTTSGPGPSAVTAPGGLRESDRLPEPIVTPATKAQSGHDENIDAEAAAELVGPSSGGGGVVALALYRYASAHAEERGIILADTKFELGSTATARSCSGTRR